MTADESKSANLHSRLLYKESFARLISKNNTAFEARINFRRFHCTKPLFNYHYKFWFGILDTMLGQNLKRNIVVSVPHFLAIPYIIADSDSLVTIPRRMAELYSKER